MTGPGFPPLLAERLSTLREHGEALEAAGLPFPTEYVAHSVETALAQGAEEQALTILKRGEALYTMAAKEWTWIKPSLDRADELGALATKIGLDVGHLVSRVGDPRTVLKNAPLSAASLSKAAASASLAVAVLTDAVPKFVVAEAQKLGETIRSARNRGEDVQPAVREFSRLLASIQDHQPVSMGEGLVAARHAVARIPRAPSIGALPSDEEEEILLEARNLARRLQRIKSRARNAQSAARLVTQVRAALSEERRYGTPEEEIEELWSEVDRLTRERRATEPVEEITPPGLRPPAPGERRIMPTLPAMVGASDDIVDLAGSDSRRETAPARHRARPRPRP